MRDDVTFEARLVDALGRLAELAPPMDDAAIARDAIAAGATAGQGGWLGTLRRLALARFGVGRAKPRVAYLLIVLALVLAAILVAIAGGALRNDGFPPLGRNGAIAFTVQGNDHGPATTHLTNADGTGDRTVDADRCPTYSADGSVLASLSSEDRSASLVIRDADGNPAHTVLLVKDPPTTVSWALSPDGTRVAWFKSILTGDGESHELWVAPVTGRPGARILPGSSVPDEFYSSPVWSPEGARIAFGSYVADAITGERRRTAIELIAADGSGGPRRVTTRPGLLEDKMSWSPDGRFLAYLGVPDGAAPTAAGDDAPAVSPPRDVYVIGADGNVDRNLTDSPAFERDPAWSPDGTTLAFETSADGEAHHVTTIHMNGPTPVGTPVPGPESEWFLWAPDGTALLWLEVTTTGTESYRSTVHSNDPDFRQSPRTLQAIDGLIVCTPSWQRLAP
jgi:hypothetical protein